MTKIMVDSVTKASPLAAPTADKKTKKATKDLENGNGKEQPSADKSFYENLPFHGLKSPPKQVKIIKCITTS